MKTTLVKLIAIICVLAVGLVTWMPFAPELAHATYDETGAKLVTYVYSDGTVRRFLKGLHGHATSHSRDYHNNSAGSMYDIGHPSHMTRTVIEAYETVNAD